MKSSFQAGVDTLYNKCVSCGSTPTSKTPTDISNAIQAIYGNRYTEGYNTGKQDGIDYGMIGQLFHVVSQQSGWAGLYVPIPPVATRVRCYTNRVDGNVCSIGVDDSNNNIGYINGGSDDPDIFNIPSGHSNINVRVNGAATHAYITFLE